MKKERNKKGQFTKGNSGKPKGSKNKKNKVLYSFFDYISKKNLHRFEEELNKLEGKQYVDAFIKLSKHCIPKGKEAEYNSALIDFFEQKIKINK